MFYRFFKRILKKLVVFIYANKVSLEDFKPNNLTMKKTNQLLAILSIVALGLLASCNTKAKKDETKQVEEAEEVKPNPDEFTYRYKGRPKSALNYKEIIEMLADYDKTRIAPLEKALGYEDSRINNYNFEEFMAYLGYIQKLSREAGITITGISFISASKPNYNNTGKSYQDLIYIPTTTIDGKQIPFDPVLSAKKKKVVTFKQALAERGYNWIYNTKKEFEDGKRADNNYRTIVKQDKAGVLTLQSPFDEDSGAGNLGRLEPPYENN